MATNGDIMVRREFLWAPFKTTFMTAKFTKLSDELKNRYEQIPSELHVAPTQYLTEQRDRKNYRYQYIGGCPA